MIGGARDSRDAKNYYGPASVIGATVIGFVVIMALSMSANGMEKTATLFGTMLLISASSATAGGMLGFLFGIPRRLQLTDNQKVRATNGDNELTVIYGANTNLEQISDWLTKILVGVGLTQLTSLPSYGRRLAEFLAPSLSPIPGAGIVSVSIVIYFCIGGFLVGYLWTRLFLGGALREADIASLGEKLTELEQQSRQDAKALMLVQQQLNPRAGSPQVSLDELKSAIAEASDSTRVAVFNQAWTIRSQTWRDPGTKARMETTIPVLKSLADGDIRSENHEFHGQLGFALRDQKQPDWRQAEKELTKAIEIRGDWRNHGWLWYEFVRLICRIHLDPEFLAKRPSAENNRREILRDLDAVRTAPDMFNKYQEEAAVVEWMTLNNISYD
jgi:hypothetical protein